MADDADRSSINEALITAAILQRHRMASAMTAPSNGTCCDCGDDIEPKRLEMVPDAKQCSECARDAVADARRRKINGGR